MPTSEAPDIWRLYAPEDLRIAPLSWSPKTLLTLLDSPSTEGLTVLSIEPGRVEISVEGLCEGKVVAVVFEVEAASWEHDEKRELLEIVRRAYPQFLRDPLRTVLRSVAEAMGVSVLA